MEPKSINGHDITWTPHTRFEGVLMKQLVTGAVNPALSIILAQVAPGKALPPHTHQSVETFYLLRGTGICTMGDKEVSFGPGSCFIAPVGFTHHLRNTGDEPVELMAIFAPPVA